MASHNEIHARDVGNLAGGSVNDQVAGDKIEIRTESVRLDVSNLSSDQSECQGERASVLYGDVYLVILTPAASAFLSSLAAPDYANDRENVGRAAPDTGSWIWKEKQYCDWSSSSTSKVIHLQGKPGSGKSVLTREVLENIWAETKKVPAQKRDTAVLYYFFNNRSRPAESGLDCLRALIHQFMSERKSDYPQLAKACHILQSKNFSDSQSWSYLSLWRVFQTMVHTFKFSTVFCIIDALDECEKDTAKSLVSNMLELMSLSKPVIKIYFSSRIRVNSKRHFSLKDSIGVITLSGEKISAEVEKDIDKLVRYQLRQVRYDLDLSQDEEDQLREEIVRRARGMFLWAILAVKEIENTKHIQNDLNPTDLIKSMPAGLPDLYGRIWRRIDPDTIKPAEKEVRRYEYILAWVLFARRPMTLSELRAATSAQEDDKSYESLKSRMVRDIRRQIEDIPFLEIITVGSSVSAGTNKDQSSTVRLIHQSAKDYLKPKLKSYEKLIMRLCVTILKFEEFSDPSWQKIPPGYPSESDMADETVIQEFRSRLQSFDPLYYAVLFWFVHLQAVGNPDDSTIALVCSFIAERKIRNNVRVWVQSFNLHHIAYPAYIDAPAMHMCASLGLASIARYLINHGHNVNERDSENRLPLELAFAFNSGTETRMLLKGNINEISDGWIPSDLNIATLCGHREALALLQEKHAEIDRLDTLGRSILHYACVGGNLEIICELWNQFPRAREVKDVYGARCRDLVINAELREALDTKLEKRDKPDKAYVKPCQAPFVNFGIRNKCYFCKKLLDGYLYRMFPPNPEFNLPIDANISVI
ncbi:unnamed protein product [Clonostachys chloroleuca]|uniref:Nephrocystin 3-like N-terminal domain-containing protein n=1 Tax=Clonostachys chloroleuca TaxID=1926264 RepID=A0AA35QCQ6_9HYPO|nr:unnamed protein product [Clonostachys chloroleuca]